MSSQQPSSPPPIKVDAGALHLHYDSPAALDVLFDGRRVWSLSATDHKASRSGLRRVPWPEPIRKRLDGETLIELREHVSGSVVARVEARFGTGDGRVAIVDDEGRPVAVTKYGRLNHPFESSDRSAVEGYLDQVEDVLAVLRDECGLPAFVSFGTLLGAVRDGRLIGHDVDVDLGFLSSATHPVDVVRETLRVERVLRGKGWRVVRENNGFLALFFPQADGTQRNLDVFACFVVGDTLYQVHDVRTKADRSAVLPLGEVVLEGRALPAPAKPEVFMEAAYGPGWRVPDPSFEYHTPRPTRRRIGGWLGGIRAQRDQWIALYAKTSEATGENEPSEIAVALAESEEPCAVVDVGCGRGHDALFLARKGFSVTGLDFATAPLKRARRTAQAEQLDATWRLCNLYSLQDVLLTAADLSRGPGPRLILARALLHDLSPEGRQGFWRLARVLLAGGGRCYVETWSALPSRESRPALPVRSPLDSAHVVAEAVAHGGRLAAARTVALDALPGRDPHVNRLVLEW